MRDAGLIRRDQSFHRNVVFRIAEPTHRGGASADLRHGMGIDPSRKLEGDHAVLQVALYVEG
jgi:hypothetical protein